MWCHVKRFCDEKALSFCCGVILFKSILQLCLSPSRENLIVSRRNYRFGTKMIITNSVLGYGPTRISSAKCESLTSVFYSSFNEYYQRFGVATVTTELTIVDSSRTS